MERRTARTVAMDLLGWLAWRFPLVAGRLILSRMSDRIYWGSLDALYRAGCIYWYNGRHWTVLQR